MTSNDYKASAKDISSRAEDAADDLRSKAEQARSDAMAQVEGVVAQAKATASGLYDKAQDNFKAALDMAPGSASDAISAGQRIYRTGTHRVGRQIIRQPIEALLLAGAIGYLVGWATHRE